MLVNELDLPVPFQQHAEIVEPGYNALELDPVHQKDGDGDLVLPDMVQKRILKVLFFLCHFPSSLRRAPHLIALHN